MTDFNPTESSDSGGAEKGVRQALMQFLSHKRSTQKESTARAYKFPNRDFVEHCEDNDIYTTDEISQRIVTTWIDKRQQEDIKPITVKNNVKHVRVFIKWMGSRELCEWGIHEKMTIPNVPDRGDVNEDVLRTEHAETTLDYLTTYNYATRYHALLHTLWHTGCRISGAQALDVQDFEARTNEANVLKFRDRPDETPLKNGQKGNRDVTISEKLTQILQDYIKRHRLDKEDPVGRDPLFTIPSGRMSNQRAYKNITAVTRPCVTSGECPHDREIEDCEAAQQKDLSQRCPSAVSMHPVRKGSITNHINEGWPKEKLSERVDVSVDVLTKHYDFRTAETKRQNREEYLHE